MFLQAEVLRVPPWQVAGFDYEGQGLAVAHIPYCWILWAQDFYNARAAAESNRMAALLGLRS